MGFRRERLPNARDFWERQFGQLRGRGRRVKVLCCLHPDHHPSLSINLVTGCFRCWSCGARGGDLIDFVMLRDKCDFKRACQTLDCWDGAELSAEAKAAQKRADKARVRLKAERLAEIERARVARIEARDWLHCCERIYREAIEGLRPDDEIGWAIAALAFDEVVDAEAEYFDVCGLERVETDA